MFYNYHKLIRLFYKGVFHMQTVKTSQLKEGMITASPVKTRRGQLIVDAGVCLTQSLIAHIDFYDVEDVSIEEFTRTRSHDWNAQAAPTYSERITSSFEFQQFQKDYATAVERLKQIFTSILEQRHMPDAPVLCKTIQPLLSDASSSLQMFDFLHNMRKIVDSIYAHSINVALISIELGRWLKFSDEDLAILISAALLHDIGKSEIPEEILYKPDRYTEEEFALVKKHPEIGFHILRPFDGLDPRILDAARMHHERCDGSGYPNRLQFHQISDFAQIIAIADVYDAMTAARSHRAPLCPFQVIADFELEGLQKYNPKYILTFLERIAYTYQNNRVRLNDGRSANILMLNRQFLSRPIVETEDGTLDLSKTPNLKIQMLL